MRLPERNPVITVSWLLVVTIFAAALSIFDAASSLRSRRHNSLLAVAELVVSVLMLLSVFLLAQYTGVLAIILLIVLVLVLLIRGSGRKGVSTITVIALILTAIVVLIGMGWLHIPGLG
jgi:fatty acid desaturase